VSTASIEYDMNFQDGQQEAADAKLVAVFYKEVIRNESKTIVAGRPIFDEIDHIKIIAPGSRDTMVTEVNDGYKQRFPKQWARYQANQDQNVSGTPLATIPWMSVGQVAELNAVGCKTAEQLVAMPDAVSQKFMGHHQLKARTQAFLDAAAGAAPLLKMQEELTKRDEQIAELRGMIETMRTNALVKVGPRG